MEIADIIEFLESTDIIRYNDLCIIVTNKHARSVDIWKLDTV